MLSEKRAKTCIYWKLGKICYERLQKYKNSFWTPFFRNSSKSHEYENTRIFFQKSARIWVNFFASLVMQNFLPHTWGDVWWNKRICHTQLKPRSWTKYISTLISDLQFPHTISCLHSKDYEDLDRKLRGLATSPLLFSEVTWSWAIHKIQ